MVAIDAVRALSCLWVIGYHAWRGLPDGASGLSVLLRAVLSHGYLGVHVFLVLSGFCVFASVSKGPVGSLDLEPRAFFARRFRRLYPAYFAALVLFTVGHLALRPDLRPLPAFAFHFGTHLFLVHNFFDETITSIDGPLWSLALEAQLYLLMPFFVAVLRTRGWRTLAIGALALTATYQTLITFLVDNPSFTLYNSVFARFFEFVCGMAACHLFYRGRDVPSQWLAAFGMLVPLGLVRTVLFGQYGILVDQIFGIGFSALLLLALRIPASVMTGRVGRALEWVGVMSYSIYLLHQPFMNNVWFPLVRKRLHDPSPTVLLLAVAIGFVPCILMLSWGFWKAFEAPFIKARPLPVRKRRRASLRGML